MIEKQERLKAANELLSIIASCGRHFFLHKDRVSLFELDQRGRVWFIDAYSCQRVYTHYVLGRWRGFSEGGTLRDVVIRLRDFILTGRQVRNTFGPWPEWYSDSDPWGYAEHMQYVRSHAERLGIQRSMCATCGKPWPEHSHNRVGHEVCP